MKSIRLNAIINANTNTGIASLCIGAAILVLCVTATAQPTSLFASRVAPILKYRCIKCHQGKSPSGGLDLTTGAALARGGLHGAVIIAGDPGKSQLYLRVSARTMPPAASGPLTDSDAAVIKQWISAGAHWDPAVKLGSAQQAVSTQRAGRDWWSLRKVAAVTPPAARPQAWVRNPIDAFILARLNKQGLAPSPPADPQALIRRVTFDLIGLPPTPAEVARFVADHSPSAYENLVNRLLADPRYGERWARHWLDVARFGESNGFERDALRPNAWPYRDYVINSFNADKPYAAFIREQIAGDLLTPSSPDRIAATGFLVGGSWDEVGVSQANATARLRVREEELEEMVGTVSQTFLGLTVNCARCHDHKFDPIPQTDYYRIKSALEGVHPGDRSAETPDSVMRTREVRKHIDEIQASMDAIELGVRTRLLRDSASAPAPQTVRPLAQWTFETDARDSRGHLNGTLVNGARVERGRLVLDSEGAYMRSAPLATDLYEKTLEAWVYLPDRAQRGGGVISVQTPDGLQFDAIVYGEREPGKWMAGSEGYNRSLNLSAPAESSAVSERIHVAIVYGGDNSITVYRNGVPYGAGYTPTGSNRTLRTFSAGHSEVLIGMRHLGGGIAFLKGEVEEARLYDRALTPVEIARSYKDGPDTVSEMAIRQAMSATEVAKLAHLSADKREAERQLRAIPSPITCYAAAPAQPLPTAVLARGDVLSPGSLVSAGGLSCVVGPTKEWGLAPEAPEAERRLHLADWLADPANPLTSRVMVNRIWHYHFGRGIVASPNDFGYNGERPLHPELLDWLAAEFVRRRGSVKQMHRLILLSNTYRQSSKFSPAAAAKDADDRTLWRYPLRRLEGEAIRDSMLAISGQLNPQFGGPSFRPFTEVVDNAHIYSQVDPGTPEQNRRTVYRMNVQSAKSPLLETLDCPDPSTKAPRRNTTTTPLQALELMNNSFVLRQARYFASRVASTLGPGAVPAQQVDLAYKMALGRAPTQPEAARSANLVTTTTAGLETLCWSLFNMSEFEYVR